MGWSDKITDGLLYVLKGLGQGSLMLKWRNTLQNDGIQMLQIEIRNFLRTASDDDRDEMRKLLKGAITDASLAPESRIGLNKVHQIYIAIENENESASQTSVINNNVTGNFVQGNVGGDAVFNSDD
jgi:hypothetical protein